MNAPIEPQIIQHEGKALYAVIPYDTYTDLVRKAGQFHAPIKKRSISAHVVQKQNDENITLPHEVVKRGVLGGVSLIRAWREYLGLSQAEIAKRMGISQPSYAKMESKSTKCRATTLKKLATVIGVQWEQLEAS